MLNSHSKALRQLGEVKRLFACRGWMSATSGNFSYRIQKSPLLFYVSVSGRDKSISRTDDFILVNDRGEPNLKNKKATKTKLKPSAEVGVHAEIYKRCSPGVILHLHTVYNTYASVHSPNRELFTMNGLEMIKGLGIWDENNRVQVPIVPNHFDLAKLSIDAGDAIQPSTPGILIRGHGLYAWGETLHDAKRNVEAFEFIFQYFVLEHREKRD